MFCCFLFSSWLRVATHRWYITGTPIEKSLHTLYAFVHFLGVIPYENIRVWRTAIEAPFKRNQIGPLLRLMQHIMWRNCKSTVKSSIGIPPQTFRTHLVDMTDIQAFFYSTQHALCSVKFSETVETVLGRASLGISLDTPIGRMTPLLLKKVCMEYIYYFKCSYGISRIFLHRSWNRCGFCAKIAPYRQYFVDNSNRRAIPSTIAYCRQRNCIAS